jgi:flagellin-like hook-associated protein FlgL
VSPARIDPVAELEYAVGQLELLLDEYQYVHAWDTTATMAQTAIDRLHQSIVQIRQQGAEMVAITTALEDCTTAAQDAVERLKIANRPVYLARLAKESEQ